MEPTFSNRQFSKALQRGVIQWLNNVNQYTNTDSVKETSYGPTGLSLQLLTNLC